MTKHFNAAYPISGEDITALPVKDIGPAVTFYKDALGFTVVSQDESKAAFQRDDVQLGVVRRADHEPGEAGSVCIAVTDLDAVRGELVARGCSEVGVFGTDEWGGKKYRTFFVREQANGYCYCFCTPE